MIGLLCALMFSAPLDLAGLTAQLDGADRTYDIAAAEQVAATLDALPESDWTSGSNLLCATSHLLSAELQRIAFERLPETSLKERRGLGEAIDGHAEAGLRAVARLEVTSETCRIKADCIGTMIRSNYRAGKMKGAMRAAVDEALRLDPGNPRALISHAKMLIFNPSAQESELREGEALLRRALSINATLEQAQLLRAHTFVLLGEQERAVALWEECLRGNPACEPARSALSAERSPDESSATNVK